MMPRCHAPARTSHQVSSLDLGAAPHTLNSPLLTVLALLLVLALPRFAAADDCEALGMTGETRAAIEDYIREAATTFDIGLYLAGGISAAMVDPETQVDGVFHLALSGGMTYAVGLDIDEYCNDFDAPLPPGLGWQIFVASNTFDDLEFGAYLRYHAQLNIAELDPILELGGLGRYHFDSENLSLGVLASVGYGNQAIGVYLQGQAIFDDDLVFLGLLGVRIDAFFFEWLAA